MLVPVDLGGQRLHALRALEDVPEHFGAIAADIERRT
jgi:hypothetical protein